MKRVILASGAALLAVVAAGPAAAQTDRSLIVERVAVAHGDLDLATTAGADAMLGRLTDAASRACGGKPRSSHADPLGPAKLRAYRLCKVGAIDTATLALAAPRVRALWLEDGEAIELAALARRTTVDLLRLARIDVDPAPPRNR